MFSCPNCSIAFISKSGLREHRSYCNVNKLLHIHLYGTNTLYCTLMTLAVNEYIWTWTRGVNISYNLKQLVVVFLLENGANPTTSKIPCGFLLVCSRTYKITKPTVYCLWRNYCSTGKLDTLPKRINLSQRLLSDEDHQSIKQLILLDPTIYKSEIRDKIYQNSNTPPV